MPGNPYDLAAELARPVARGYLTRTQADVALLHAAYDAQRAGSTYDPRHVYGGLRHILGLHLERLETQRAITEMRVRRRIKPLLALRQPRNVVLAEAHDVNGADGFPLDEPAVTLLADRQAFYAGRQRHG